MHDLTCVAHLHSTHSDGTGTIPEIARAAADAGVDVVLLTDHDTLAGLDEEGWHGEVLVLVGEEVSPLGQNHYLAFGLSERIRHKGMSPADIVGAVREAGGFGFAAHPFSQGNDAFARIGKGMPWHDLDCLDGLEVWSMLTDTAEGLRGWRDALAFVARPERFVTNPPARNLAEWDRLGRTRRVRAIGGLDAHQIGKRIGNRVPLRLMSYRRSFRLLHTHVLCEELPTGALEHDRRQVYDALREGRSYIALDQVAPARGFAFHADEEPMGTEMPARKVTLRASVPRPAQLRLLRDGQPLVESFAPELEHVTSEPGVYRVEAHLDGRTWILSNPIYMRA